MAFSKTRVNCLSVTGRACQVYENVLSDVMPMRVVYYEKEQVPSDVILIQQTQIEVFILITAFLCT